MNKRKLGQDAIKTLVDLGIFTGEHDYLHITQAVLDKKYPPSDDAHLVDISMAALPDMFTMDGVEDLIKCYPNQIWKVLKTLHDKLEESDQTIIEAYQHACTNGQLEVFKILKHIVIKHKLNAGGAFIRRIDNEMRYQMALEAIVAIGQGNEKTIAVKALEGRPK